MSQLYTALQQYFGYSGFRPLQENIVKSILNNQDTFVLMPTGGGKSLCYQLPSIVLNGTTIVISPLISLMKDQVDVLTQNGVNAAYLNSSLLTDEQNEVIDKLKNNQLSLLYVAPERLVQDNFLQILKETSINFFAIDEAHCISQWGHDFRPEYRRLNIIRQHFPDKPLIALTATATPRVKNDIIDKLNLRKAQIFQASFNRPNLTYSVIDKNNPYDQLTDYIHNHANESGIIYCQSRQTVETVAAHLQQEGINALPYHAGLPDAVRAENQERFIRDDTQIIVATIAFGMGIDKPNVRFVIHFNLPKSLEHYYQETGRAGRDGLASECILLFNYADKFTHERFIREMENETEQQIALQQLYRVIEFSQSTLCRRNQLLHYFAEESTQNNCASCDNCISPKETFDATIISQKILSCIYRVRGRFGIAQIVNILTGSKAQKIFDNNHHTLSTYGIVTDYSRNDIRNFIYELIHSGYIRQSQDQYGIIGLTEKSRTVLENKEKVFLRKPAEITVKRRKETEPITINAGLFNTLRSLRKKLADEANLPPYIIFSDASLKDMAATIPKNKVEFRKIKGVGEKKLQAYADIFLSEIQSYIQHYH